jgi:hypothetical protein
MNRISFFPRKHHLLTVLGVVLGVAVGLAMPEAVVAQGCDETGIATYIEELGRLDFDRIDSLIGCGELAVPAVVESLEQSVSASVRLNMIYALDEIGSEYPAVVSALTEALLDESAYVRESAALVLTKMGIETERKALRILVDLLVERYRNINGSCNVRRALWELWEVGVVQYSPPANVQGCAFNKMQHITTTELQNSSTTGEMATFISNNIHTTIPAMCAFEPIGRWSPKCRKYCQDLAEANYRLIGSETTTIDTPDILHTRWEIDNPQNLENHCQNKIQSMVDDEGNVPPTTQP